MDPRSQVKINPEFKLNVAKQGASTTLEGIAEYVSALANGACISDKDFGYLVFGIEDGTQKVVGTKFRPGKEKKGNQDFEFWLRMVLSPKVSTIFSELRRKKIIVNQGLDSKPKWVLTTPR
jgi:predicted HTH transcriptional regulator